MSLGIPRGWSGGPRGSLGRRQKGPETQKGLSECLGGGLGALGDFGRLRWSVSPSHGVKMWIFLLFQMCVFHNFFDMFKRNNKCT